MKKKRIVVTGMGVVSCFGNEVEPFYQALLEGKSGVKPIEHFPVEDATTRFAASIVGFDPGDYMDKKTARRTDPYIRYAMVAGKKALQHAHLFSPKNSEQIDKNGLVSLLDQEWVACKFSVMGSNPSWKKGTRE